MKECLILSEDQINFFKVNPDSDNNRNPKSFGLYKINQHYLCDVIIKNQDYVTSRNKNSLGRRIEKLEGYFCEIKWENI